MKHRFIKLRLNHWSNWISLMLSYTFLGFESGSCGCQWTESSYRFAM